MSTSLGIPTPPPTAPDPAPKYPVHVEADLDPNLSRGLWLVKWLLAIPHYVVLLFLWVGFAVTTAVAFVSILATGRYPRTLFDFNVGVMRWNWRVSYYSYSALGTDRYPPFILADVPDYPAHLDVDYPEHLSRGLALVKWWLLAIPHYLVIGLFVGGIGYGLSGADDDPVLSVSLVGVLVLVAAVMLLVTGRYPQPLFDLLLGLNRWVLRVAAYASLMTDRYPPFRLDQGGHEPGASSGRLAQTPSKPPAHTSERWTAGRVVALTLGSLLVLTSLTVAGAGATLAVIDQSRRDDGFLMSTTEQLATDTYALTTGDARIHTTDTPDWLPDMLIGDVRLEAESTTGRTLFIGVAPANGATAYLTDVGHATLTDWTENGPAYDTTIGEQPATAPEDQSIWVASDTGSTPNLTWNLTDGDWTIVLMNTDGSSPVSARVRAGAEVPALHTAIGFLLTLAALLLLAGGALVVTAVRLASHHPHTREKQ